LTLFLGERCRAAVAMISFREVTLSTVLSFGGIRSTRVLTLFLGERCRAAVAMISFGGIRSTRALILFLGERCRAAVAMISFGEVTSSTVLSFRGRLENRLIVAFCFGRGLKSRRTVASCVGWRLSNRVIFAVISSSFRGRISFRCSFDSRMNFPLPG